MLHFVASDLGLHCVANAVCGMQGIDWLTSFVFIFYRDNAKKVYRRMEKRLFTGPKR